MECEVRYFFGIEDFNDIKNILSKHNYVFSARELTVMYDNPNPVLSFYDAAIDGRLRLRTSKVIDDDRFGLKPADCSQESFCLLTWKRRIPEFMGENIRREEEIESRVYPEDADNLERILEHVLKCPRISSYERIRHNFDSEYSKITLDEFPYGLMLEFELKDNANEADMINQIESSGLSISNASKLSCDDKYFELCRENNLTPKSDICYSDNDMPKIQKVL